MTWINTQQLYVGGFPMASTHALVAFCNNYVSHDEIHNHECS